MRRSGEFTSVVRDGARSRRGCLVVHMRRDLSGEQPPRIGMVVGKTVGGSVERHRVTRRLRAQMATRVNTVPAGAGVVIRALPPAATATSARLGADLDAALRRLLKEADR
jgi:ribonuclease P protein component